MSSIPTFYKQPGETLDYDVDYSRFFADTDTDNIDSSGACTAVITGTGSAPDARISAGPTAVGAPDSRLVKTWIAGGVDGVTYKVTLTVTTHDGRVKETDFNIKIKAL